MAKKFPEVFGVGQCALDYLGRIPSWPPPDVKCEFSDLTVQGGGPVATALVALSRWGVSCAFAGVTGDDAYGAEILDSLAREGVDTGAVIVRPGGASQFAFITAEEGSGRRTIFWRRPTGRPPAPGEIDLAPLGNARVFLTDGLFPEASIAAARESRERGTTVVVDAGSLREGMLELAGLSDVFLASETFGRAFAAGAAPLEVCRLIAGLGPAVAGVTLGGRGYAALVDGREILRPAYPVNVVDTTGCGDVFHGGYIYGHLLGWKAEKSLDFASWAASRVSLRLGGRAGIPSPGDYPGPESG